MRMCIHIHIHTLFFTNRTALFCAKQRTEKIFGVFLNKFFCKGSASSRAFVCIRLVPVPSQAPQKERLLSRQTGQTKENRIAYTAQDRAPQQCGGSVFFMPIYGKPF